MSSLKVAVVIPTLNEQAALERRLPAVLGAADEVVVSDGGSTDHTVDVARHHGVTVVNGKPGRGPQLNRGARTAEGTALVFLHADTDLPQAAIPEVRHALEEGAVGGGFLVRFASRRPIFRLVSEVVNLRTRLSRSPLGDQAQFATRAAFEAVGGYPEWPILEDLAFIRQLKKHGRIAVLDSEVSTSVRRFEQGGILQSIARNWLIFGCYFAGVSPFRLAKLYRHTR